MSLKISACRVFWLLEAKRNANCHQSVRTLATHWDPKFKKLRAQKIVKPKLVDLDNPPKREEAVKRGVKPAFSFSYKPLNLTSSTEVFDPYLPTEGDGKASIFSKEFATGALESLKKSTSTFFKHKRAITKHDKTFDEKIFGSVAQQIYIDAHNSLMTRDNETMLNYVTEHALKIMTDNMKYKTFKWQWVESLEEPEVKHIITRELLSNTNVFAQITVRIHSKQILAVYDRFGRLAFGSDKLAKDVLEYVVFERNLGNPYVTWRVHEKITPSWAPPKDSIRASFVMPELEEVDQEAVKNLKSKFKQDDKHLDAGTTDRTEQGKKQLPTA